MSGLDQRMPPSGRRSLVLGVGILSTALSLAGLVTYAVVQVKLIVVQCCFSSISGTKPQISVWRISVSRSVSQLSGILVNCQDKVLGKVFIFDMF